MKKNFIALFILLFLQSAQIASMNNNPYNFSRRNALLGTAFIGGAGLSLYAYKNPAALSNALTCASNYITATHCNFGNELSAINTIFNEQGFLSAARIATQTSISKLFLGSCAALLLQKQLLRSIHI